LQVILNNSYILLDKKSKFMKKVFVIIGLVFLISSCWEKLVENNEKLTENNKKIEIKKKWEYKIYNEEIVSSTKWLRVIFFYEEWNKESIAFKEYIEKFWWHDGLTFFEADFNKNSDLKEKYGISEWHSFVFLDSELNAIKKWKWGTTIMDMHKSIKTNFNNIK
jgi:hypothetical protein